MSEVSQASLSDPWKMFGSEMAYKKWRRGILGGRKIQRFSGRREYNSSAAAKSLQLCPTLCDPIDGSPPGSPVPGILQARTLQWVVISFSNAWKWKVKVKLLSRVRLLATPWTAAYQAPPSMGFSRQEHWSGVPSPSLICCALYFYYFHQLYLRSSGLRSPRLGTPALCDHHWRFLEI